MALQENDSIISKMSEQLTKVREYMEKMNEVHIFMEQKLKWKKTIPPMPTSRNPPDILSLPSVLIVAGGHTESNWIYAPAVEIFKPDVSQWYTTDPLPTPCTNVSLTSVGNICYALGGFSSPWHLNHALYASVDDLLLNAVPANQTTHRDTQSAWKTLSNTPNYGPSAGVLGGNLLAIGGTETASSSVPSTMNKKIHMYSPSTTSWIYVSDLPAPHYNTAVAVLSSTEILVIGGLNDSDDYAVNTTYKGALQLKK